MNKLTILISASTLIIGLVLGNCFFKSEKKESFYRIQNCVPQEGQTAFSCGMHPQVHLAEKGNCPFCGMQLVSTSLLPQHNKNILKLSESAIQIADIQTVKIKHSNLVKKEIEVFGEVVKDESRVFKQIAHLPGQIENLYVNKVGQQVRKGQKIAKVYSKEMIAVIEAFEYSKRSESVIRSAHNNLKNWKIKDKQLAQFDIKGDYRKAVNIFADKSGIVTKVHAKAGDLATNTHMGKPTVYYEIADLSKVWVMFELYEKQLAWVNEGDMVNFNVSAYLDKVFKGKINQINPEINPKTRTISVRVIIDNEEGLLKPGMFATGRITVEKEIENTSIAIPKSAVLWAGDRTVVYVKLPENDTPVFQYREVKINGENDETFWCSNGIEAGEEVVVKGAFRIDAAAQLLNKNSLMNFPERNDDEKVSPKLVNY